MFIDKLILASRDSEKDYYLSGASTVNSTSKDQSHLPFGVFPRLNLDCISFYDVTLFCGGCNTVKSLLLDVIANKLGSKVSSEKLRGMQDYCRFTSFRYTSFENRNFPVKVFSKQKNEEIVRSRSVMDGRKNKHSLIKFYERFINGPALYILELPESSMSLEEQYELSSLIFDAVKYYGAQFIITTNSPLLLGIKGALIYDFDSYPIVPHTWSNSPLVNRLTEISKEMYLLHKRT